MVAGTPRVFYSPLSDAMEAFGMNEQLIANWLPASGVIAILARRGDGKTLALLDQALCFATDRDWLGFETAKGRTAIYCCAEDTSGTLQNALAWYRRAGIEPHDAAPRFLFVPDVPNLLSEAECKEIVKLMRERLPPDAKPVIFLDTWQRATKAATMNDDTAMQKAMHNAEMIGRELGGPVVVACHPPKGNSNTIAGSMVIENDTVAIWIMRRPEGKRWGKRDREIRVDRIKGPGFDTVAHVKIAARDIGGVDTLGRPRTGALLEPIMEPSGPADDDADQPNHVRALAALCDFGQAGATWSEWFRASELPRSSFCEALDRLKADKAVIQVEGKRYVAVSELPEGPIPHFGPGPGPDLNQTTVAGHA